MTVVVLVRRLDQGLELGDVVRVCKVDHINGDIVLPESLSKALKLGELLLKRVTAEDDNTGLGVLVHSVLE